MAFLSKGTLLGVAAAVLSVGASAPAAIINTYSRIAPGGGTNFAAATPAIPNPSATDLAQSATFTLTGNGLTGGGQGVLHNGVLGGTDDTTQSVFFNGTVGPPATPPTGTILVDLGQTVNITQINTYSRHENATETGGGARAPQSYTVSGSTDNVTFTPIFTVNNPTGGGAVGNSITDNAGGSVGSFRYLSFAVAASSANSGTFYQEIDVVPEPASLCLVGFSGLGLLARRRRAGH